MQQPTDESIGQRKDLRGRYFNIALVAGQYKIYFPSIAFDPPMQSVTYNVISRSCITKEKVNYRRFVYLLC